MKIIILLATVIVVGCSNMDTLSVRPSTTTITYGHDSSTAEKDAKNDVLTDTEKKSWTIKQVFKWE
jgi:hypothetical protein